MLVEETVYWYEQSGTLHGSFRAPRGTSRSGLAVDAEGNLYQIDGIPNVTKFSNAGADLADTLDGGEASGLTIDPSNNQLYVVESAGFVSHFALNCGENCTPLDSFGTGQLSSPQGVAVDGETHTAYVANTGASDVAVYTALVLPDATTGPVTGAGRTSGTLTGHLDPADGGEVTSCHFEYGASTSYGLGSLPCSPAAPYASAADVTATVTGLIPETTYHYRLAVANAKGASDGGDQSFTTPPAVAALGTQPPTAVGSTSATLNGSFDGNGEDTHYYFEWGTQPGTFIHNSPSPPADAGSPAGPNADALAVTLTELNPGTTYYYRAVASNAVGTTTSPNEEQLTTPPALPMVSASAGEVHSESALLHAKVDPEGGATKYHFEYGTADCAHSSCESTPAVEISAGDNYESVSAQLRGLARGTTYHYRVVASNYCNPKAPGEECTTDGPDQTFTTFSFIDEFNESCSNALDRQQTGAALLLDCRSYELVSASHTGGYNVSSDLSEGSEAPYGGYSEAESPARVLYSVDHGAIPGTNQPTNKGSDPYVATRGENGWSTEYVGIPANDPFARKPFSSVPSGTSASLEAFAFGAPGGCSPCFEGGYTGIPVRLPNGELVQGMVGSLNPGPAAKPAGQIGKDLSADGTHFVFGSNSKFEPEGNEGEVSIYDHNLSSGETHVVSKTSSGETMKEEGEEISELDISQDGSHILIGKLTGEAEGAKLYHLYMNVGDEAKTTELTPGAAEGVRYDGMTADGKKVFFSSEEHLTGEDEQHTGADIFMWQEGQPLTLISTGTEGDAGSCDPAANTLHSHWNTRGAQNCGDVAVGGSGGVAAGNGTFFFLSPSLLDGSQEPEDGVKSAPNLYVVRPGQAPHFVATLESALTGPLQSRRPLLRSFGSFTRPEFISTDQSTGDVYVADTATGTISKMNSAGEPVTSWRENGKLALGGGIATDPSNGNLYVGTGGEIKEFTPAGLPIRSFSDGTNGYEHGIAVDAAGNVYVYGSFYQYIAKFTSTGEEIGTVLSNVSATGIAIDHASGELYVDREGKTVERYSFNGAGKAINPKIIASGLSNASGVAVDSAHDVYVDEGNQVLEVNSSGEEVSTPIGAGVLSGSDAVGVGSAGDVYAGDPPHSNLAEFGPAEASPNLGTDNPAVADAVSEPETRRTADFQVSPLGGVRRLHGNAATYRQ